MATQSPFSLLEEFLQILCSSFQPPDWAVEETQRRVVLLLNHVLMQEPAIVRLAVGGAAGGLAFLGLNATLRFEQTMDLFLKARMRLGGVQG